MSRGKEFHKVMPENERLFLYISKFGKGMVACITFEDNKLVKAIKYM